MPATSRLVGLLVAATAIAAVTHSFNSRVSAAAGGDIKGIVQGARGGEAGVWVIAETTDLETTFRRIVVTNDEGRFLIPDLPVATYQVWVRGYGLRDTAKKASKVGDDLTLIAQDAATPQEAAQVYPANYWYSLLNLPSATEFPGTGQSGSANGIAPNMRTQADWIDRLKDGCQLCHQLGNKATREMPMLNLKDFPSTTAAWEYRLHTGPSGGGMASVLNRLGHRRALQMFADWSDRIKAGEVPPQPPRPRGQERNIVLTMWAWGTPRGYVHDNIATDKRNPRLYGGQPVYGLGGPSLLIADPIANRTSSLRLPGRDVTEGRRTMPPSPSLYWGTEPAPRGPGNGHNPMMDDKGRIWLTQTIRPANLTPRWCKDEAANAFSRYFPIERGGGDGRQLSYYDTHTQKFVMIDTCYDTHHLQFAENADNTLWMSGDQNVVGWVNTKQFDQTSDEKLSQGWCPTVLDTNGDGRITRPWNEPDQDIDPVTRHLSKVRNPADPHKPFDPKKDTQIIGFAYGIIPNPKDGSVWIARREPVPGNLVRLDPGKNPPETCRAEIFEPPFQNPAVDENRWGYGPRGVDIDRNGVIWTALGGSGHIASLDRRKCKGPLNGPKATGQHCPEGWTLYQTPGPKMKNVSGSANADYHYYNWVDQFNTLGLGENVPMATGTGSDSLLALIPQTREWVVMRVPYPLGFYARGLNGRIDDPKAGWKGRGVWASYDTLAQWHDETGKGTTSSIIRFQIRPNPLEP